MKFVEFEPRHADAYRRFCHALTGHMETGAAAKPFRYYLSSPGITIRRHLIVDEGAGPTLVIGAVDIKIQQYVLGGATIDVAAVVYPVSLGAVDPRYGMAGLFLFRKLAQHYPLNFMLGMGNPDANPAARLGRAMGWTLRPIPYLYLPMRVGPLLQRRLGRRPGLARIVQRASRLGLFSPADALLRAGRRAWPARGDGVLSIRRVAEFDASMDAFWCEYVREVAFSLVRDAAQLNAMFPGSIDAFEKLTIRLGNRVVGYAILLVPPAGAGRFGDAHVATLVEFAAVRDHLSGAVRTLRGYLHRKGLDAVITNVSNAPTEACLKEAGFRARPTSMFLAASKPLEALFARHGIATGDMLITRGDGDGPVGLGVDL